MEEQFENHFKRIDNRISKIIKDMPYLLIFTKDNVYRIYFINLNFFKSYKDGKPYKCLFFELFDMMPMSNKLFMGVGNYRHISHSVPGLLEKKTGEKIITYSLRMNGGPFRSFDKCPFVDYYCFENEKLCLMYPGKSRLDDNIKDYSICEIE